SALSNINIAMVDNVQTLICAISEQARAAAAQSLLSRECSLKSGKLIRWCQQAVIRHPHTLCCSEWNFDHNNCV
ncbi:hypothetical protein, partial [Oleiphilus sp. HI0080]|uniref:hypothetical protein n=1 Tax=Oleiphilus sp. HI0080 TaxID=1822255 RepID=UPI001E5B5C9C